MAEYDVQLSAVVNQLRAEGQDPALAQRAYEDAVNDLVHTQGRLDTSMYAAAAQYALAKHSDAGAAHTIDGLVQTFSNPNIKPGDAMAAMGGVMVSAVVAAGVLTAGAGAAVVGGLSIAGSLLNSIFGGDSGPSASLCGFTLSNPPPCAVGGCMLSDVCLEEPGKRMPYPDSDLWRLFPDPHRDAVWFNLVPMPFGMPVSFDWARAHWVNAASRMKPLESLFGSDVWRVLDLETSNAALKGVPADFLKAFVAAYKKNKEFVLNGLKQPMADWEVLVQTAMTWNRAHQPGGGAVIRRNAPAPFGGWVEMASPQDTPGGVLHLNTGAKKILLAPSMVGRFGNILGTGPIPVRIGIGQPAPASPSKLPAWLGAGAGAGTAFWLLGTGPFGAILLAGAAVGALVGNAWSKRPKAPAKAPAKTPPKKK